MDFNNSDDEEQLDASVYNESVTGSVSKMNRVANRMRTATFDEDQSMKSRTASHQESI